jgi:predicted dehydrogenase
LVTRQIEDFNRAIQEDRDPAASGIDGLKVVQVTVGMVESASTGRTVKLEPLPV